MIFFIITFRSTIQKLWGEIEFLTNWRYKKLAQEFFFDETRLLSEDIDNFIEELAESERISAISEVSRSLGHDLKSPMGTFERLLSLPHDSQISDYRGAISGAIVRMNQMIEALRRPHSENSISPVNCDVSFELGWQDLNPKAKKRNISIKIPPIVISVRLDQFKFNRAWLNLLTNAIEFAKTVVIAVIVITRLG